MKKIFYVILSVLILCSCGAETVKENTVYTTFYAMYDFAKEIFAQAVKLGEKEYADVKVIPVTTAEYGISKAARPFNSRLDRKRICEEGFQPLPVWKNALEKYLQEVLAERKG